MYQNCQKHLSHPCVLILRDANSRVYGAYLSEPPSPTAHYYGNGSCFVYERADNGLRVFLATGKNEYYMYSKQNMVCVGGGKGAFALCIDDEWAVSSQVTDTFDNEAFCLEKVEIVALEVWALYV